MRLKCALLLLALGATVALYVLTARPFLSDRDRLVGEWVESRRPGMPPYHHYLLLRSDGAGTYLNAYQPERERWKNVRLWVVDERSKTVSLMVAVSRRNEDVDIGGPYEFRSGWTCWGYFGEHLRLTLRDEGTLGFVRPRQQRPGLEH